MKLITKYYDRLRLLTRGKLLTRHLTLYSLKLQQSVRQCRLLANDVEAKVYKS